MCATLVSRESQEAIQEANHLMPTSTLQAAESEMCCASIIQVEAFHLPFFPVCILRLFVCLLAQQSVKAAARKVAADAHSF